MGSSLSLQNFHKNGTRNWAINCEQRKELLFSSKMHSGTRNRPNPSLCRMGRDRAHRVNVTLTYIKRALEKNHDTLVGVLDSRGSTRSLAPFALKSALRHNKIWVLHPTD
ncbi:hypothetical protein AVEN_58831-1 [Araneus ventricosus]|uniref:Uncharacterized protein n=1 Tax=Araneus ventricosus TaxID=182803 RepID=A0A4Y2VCZ0_ARAVE|nr:hypothetical protein AVEN_250789-1 [Araneus ventricosus]GBO22383.1 hypothetical protein AVEN_91135-1 [Araneus ventricosus]GBO22388.1 hypothetical protein AVEN_105401-1 [Araneus ventricosus]GBO22501.1 hypothetical protein AVEN_58831-1 [Araneus ventricosus]